MARMTHIERAWWGVLFIALQSSHFAEGQSCTGVETFDKVTAATLSNSNRTPLYSSIGNTVTAECNNRCRASVDCPAYVIDYDQEACYRLDANSDNNRDLITPTDKRINYFEKVCLNAPACEKAWIYERVIGFVVEGFDNRVVGSVGSRVGCQELCLLETEFQCLSAEYVYSRQECRLSSESRRSQPASYRATTEKIDYLENQCGKEKNPEKCQYDEFNNQDLGFSDIQVTARTQPECADQCDQTSAFNCRSFTYFPGTSVCRLSGDDNISAGPQAVATRQGADYYQRSPCLNRDSSVGEVGGVTSPAGSPRSDPGVVTQVEPRVIRDTEQGSGATRVEEDTSDIVSLQCTAESMTVTLSTNEPFKGRLYAQKKPRDCEVKASQRTETSLTFYFDEEGLARCGVEREEKGVYSNVIVVQHHPVIQRKGDRAIQLYCFFETGEKLVTDSYNVISDVIQGPDGSTPPSTVSSVVNATAPAPGVRLRITDENGEDISGTRLGNKLFLRIEMDQESIFGIFARNLAAISGDNEERIDLLDDRGCPTDAAIFPGLQKVNGTRDLQGKFEAFKFSDTSVVRFQVNVQFCVDECNPVDCGDGVLSYGKRKRRSADRDDYLTPGITTPVTAAPGGITLLPQEPYANRLVYDPNLDQDVIYSDIPLRKEIIVDSGTTIDSFRDPRRIDAGGVFIEGYDENEVVCTTWQVLIAAGSAVVFLQLCILVTCILCIYTARRGRGGKYQQQNHDRFSMASGRTSRSSANSNPVHSGPATLYHSQLTYRSPAPPSLYSRNPETNTASTLKSLRTSLRD